MKRYGTEIINIVLDEGEYSIIEFSNGVRKLVKTAEIKLPIGNIEVVEKVVPIAPIVEIEPKIVTKTKTKKDK